MSHIGTPYAFVCIFGCYCPELYQAKLFPTNWGPEKGKKEVDHLESSLPQQLVNRKISITLVVTLSASPLLTYFLCPY